MDVRWVAVIALAGCGGGDKLTGTISGSSVTINSTAAQAGNDEVSFVLSSVDDICDELQGTIGEPDSQNLAALIRNTDASSNPIPTTTGEYAVGAATGMSVTVHYSSYGDNCASPGAADATGGSITLSAVDTTTGIVTGTLDLDFGSDHLGGTFTTANCPKLNLIKCVVEPD